MSERAHKASWRNWHTQTITFQAKKYPVIDVQYYKDEAYNEHWDHSRYYIICPKCKAELRIDNESLMKDYNLGKVFESCDKYEEKLQEAKNWIDNYDYEMMSERDKLKELMKSLPKSPKRKRRPA